jgi:hypothetical protein
MLATRFTELVGCTVPIQQAGMGEAATPELDQKPIFYRVLGSYFELGFCA